MALEGGEGWRAVNDFTVRWSNPAGQVSPIVRARYRLCEGSQLHRGQPRGRGPRVAAAPGPSPGRVHAACLAGGRRRQPRRRARERSASACASTMRRRPRSSRLPIPSDPLSVVASVADRGAGVVAGSIEARRVGEPVWRDLGARLGGERLVGRLDDAALPDGTYEVRAHLRDGAGNERTADRRRDGSPMLVSLPARAATRIVLGERRRCKRRRGGRSLHADRGPVRGNGITIRGELRAGDRPLVRSPIVVLTAPRNGGPLSRAATVVTDAAGRFSFAHRRGAVAHRAIRLRRHPRDPARAARRSACSCGRAPRSRSTGGSRSTARPSGSAGGWCGARFPTAAS